MDIILGEHNVIDPHLIQFLLIVVLLTTKNVDGLHNFGRFEIVESSGPHEITLSRNLDRSALRVKYN